MRNLAVMEPGPMSGLEGGGAGNGEEPIEEEIEDGKVVGDIADTDSGDSDPSGNGGGRDRDRGEKETLEGEGYGRILEREEAETYIHALRHYAHYARLLKHEFVRFKNTVLLWSMHPWERDARLVKEAIKKGKTSYGVLVEIACTRSSEELLGARKAYHSLFDHSIEEDVASHIHGIERKLLVALVSAYRYEGPKIKNEHAKSEAKIIYDAIKNAHKKPINEDDEVIRILATRSKPHLKALYNHYKDISGKNLDEDLDDIRFKEAVQCLCTPQIYFCKVLDSALKIDVDKNTKKALGRVIVTRADIDIKEIMADYNNLYGVTLPHKIQETAKGNYKDFLLNLIARGSN